MDANVDLSSKVDLPISADEITDGSAFVKGNEVYIAKRIDGARHTKERNFEDDIELALERCGWHTFRKERELGESFMVAQKDYDRKLALKTESLINFVKETQPKEWAKIEGLYGSNTEREFIKRACDHMNPHNKRDGLLNTLRHGFKMTPNAHFKLCYFEPASDLNPQARQNWDANKFEVVRQLRYGTLAGIDEGDSVDVVLFVNGIPLVTMELKNNLSGQSTADAVKQYKEDRSPKELLFKPNRRSLVHFALDSETVEMCTWLKGKASKFLPFNMGNGLQGAGNPANPNGYRTAYLYERILSPSSLMDIVQRFMSVEYDKDTQAMKAVIFPRYHQLDAVRNIALDAKAEGAGKSYLIQHSAGSGKSYTIGWLTHTLSSLHDANDSNVFDSVVILTDRKNLDTQLSDTVEEVEHKRGVVVRIKDSDGSAGLRDALNSGAKIITSTIQKFPYICQETKVSGKKFAIIIDEAHSSQTGTSHAKMKLALADINSDVEPLAEDEEQDSTDLLLEELKAQGSVPNLSFFAFTATPKQATLEVFGTRDEKCTQDKNDRYLPRPFHLYSMKQAIDEGFILDVLQNYTCYQQYYKLAKTIENDPRYKGSKANPALLSIAANDPHTVAAKAGIIVEHFASVVAGLLDDTAKAMVVTRSRPAAYRLYLAIKQYSAAHGYDLKPLVAFSGTLNVDGCDLTESSINGYPESQTAEVFDQDDRRIIICANKFQTGFNQKKLCAMYVDKQLTGVAAVQTLSRLNRCYPDKYTYIVDFVNDWETIRASFATYYEATELDTCTDPNVIYDIKNRLDGFRIYEDAEVEAIAKIWFDSPEPAQVLRKAESLLAPAVDKWKALDPKEAKLFKALLKKFCRNYAFIGQMIQLGDVDLHKFYVYAGLLIKKLYVKGEGIENLHDKVQLEYLRIKELGTKSISLEAETLHNGAANAGVPKDEETEYLSELVARMNEQFGTDWQDADKIFHACTAKILEDDTFVEQCKHNPISDVAAVFGNAMMGALAAILSESQEMATAFGKNEGEYMKFLNDNLLPFVYRQANKDE